MYNYCHGSKCCDITPIHFVNRILNRNRIFTKRNNAMSSCAVNRITDLMMSTRMYSSRMRTVHCSDRLIGGVASWGRWLPKGVCLPRRVSARGDVCPGISAMGVSTGGGGARCLPRVCLPGGGCLPGGVCLSACW